MSREVYKCVNGERNIITKELFCNKFNEFCKHVDDCGIKALTAKGGKDE